MSGLLLYCRGGFEAECAREAESHAFELGIDTEAEALPGGGAVFLPLPEEAADELAAQPFFKWVFARQCLRVIGHVEGLPERDRTGPIALAVPPAAYCELWLEAADTEAGKPLLPFCRKFAPYLEKALLERKVKLGSTRGPRLHIFFTDKQTAWLATSEPDNASPWPQGIPRLRFPHEAPSRSTMKLAEAFHVFLDHDDQQRYLKQGLRVVDLGAAPGGWTWQFASRGLKVTAVDNGRMDKKLMAEYAVTHVQDDGFRYRPVKPVDWMVCDMVEQPARIAQLVAKWLAEGWCRRSIFNLKLPMKKRYEEFLRCKATIQDTLRKAKVPYRLRFKQLYHDREEVTGYLERRE